MTHFCLTFIAQYNVAQQLITLQRQNLKKLAKINQYLNSYVAQDTPTPKWIKEKASDFIKNISQEKMNTLCAYLESPDSTNINATTINQIIHKSGEIVVEASKESFKSVTKTN